MYLISKRIFDFLASFIAIILLFPLFGILAFILRITGEGEVIYSQSRIGYKNKTFNMLKFATMLKNSPNMKLGTITVFNDPRVTLIGRFLRKSKLNELPQLYNVINGDLSIVGPRPLPLSEVMLYNKQVQSNIYNVKPGITGIGSLVFRDEELIIKKNKPHDPQKFYSQIIIPYKGDLELWYQENISFNTDIKIIILTIISIFFPKNSLFMKMFNNLPPIPNTLKLL